MLRTLNSRAKLRERMRSHDFGRTSLTTWQWNQGPTVESRQSSFATIQVPPTSQALNPLEPLESLASKVEPSDAMPFSSSVQQDSPLTGVQETGRFRHRVCSAMGLTQGLEYDRGSRLTHVEP
ncbi:hypothetical protein M413DRAFT_311294 [Hebeloma cylindrosporum]|uniref:Uncharacterized protein n=1 Tax=Hebeloma cylindrosporum TaxID=76867 RepID=A0A0C2YZC4_HEBCY|nr:hypothetical protein M413DRAFT_311294 [Hebeloma cylindrosporum h7]